MDTPAGTAGGVAGNEYDFSAGPMALSHSQGATSAGNDAANDRSETGSWKNSEAFTTPRPWAANYLGCKLRVLG